MRSMGTPNRLTGTAVAQPDDPASQIDALELAQSRLERSALVTGVFIGEPVFETVHARGRGKGYLIITVTAPVLDTGSDEKVDTAIAYLDPTLEDLGDDAQ